MTFQNSANSWDASNENVPLITLARRILRDRARRDEFLPDCLFGESAWDAILVLYTEGPNASHSAETLSHVLDLPVTTMARWIAVLETEGLIDRRPKSLFEDGLTVRLSAAGINALQGYLSAMKVTP